jgi:hypothetical protein
MFKGPSENKAMAPPKKFEQLIRMEIGTDRYMVLSRSITGRYSLAQQIRVTGENKEDIYLFIKNAFSLDEEKLRDFSEKLSSLLKNR